MTNSFMNYSFKFRVSAVYFDEQINEGNNRLMSVSMYVYCPGLWMNYTEEYFRYDTENNNDDSTVWGSAPARGHYEGITLDYCYYTAS